MLGCGFGWSGLTTFFSFGMSFLLRKVKDVTTISKPGTCQKNAVLIIVSTYSPRRACSNTYVCKVQGLRKVQTVIIACIELQDWDRASRFGSSLTETETWTHLWSLRIVLLCRLVGSTLQNVLTICLNHMKTESDAKTRNVSAMTLNLAPTNNWYDD